MEWLWVVLVFVIGVLVGRFGGRLWTRARVTPTAPKAGVAQLVDLHGREIARKVLDAPKREIVKYHGRGPNTRYVFKGVNKQGLYVYQEAPRG